jgi:uridylate kinase
MPAFERVVVKVSGESLKGEGHRPVSPEAAAWLAGEMRSAHEAGAELGVVIGGGNILRGASVARRGADRVAADQMGMLATIINALAFRVALEKQGLEAHVMSAIPCGTLAEPVNTARARAYLCSGGIVIFAGGTGNPFFSTDTAAALRASEIMADGLLKGTKTDGIYDADPAVHPDAKRYAELTYTEAIERRLAVMDTTAFSLCREQKLPIVVFDLWTAGNIRRVVDGESVGTVVKED